MKEKKKRPSRLEALKNRRSTKMQQDAQFERFKKYAKSLKSKDLEKYAQIYNENPLVSYLVNTLLLLAHQGNDNVEVIAKFVDDHKEGNVRQALMDMQKSAIVGLLLEELGEETFKREW